MVSDGTNKIFSIFTGKFKNKLNIWFEKPTSDIGSEKCFFSIYKTGRNKKLILLINLD